jgi:hypothetical protein
MAYQERVGAVGVVEVIMRDDEPLQGPNIERFTIQGAKQAIGRLLVCLGHGPVAWAAIDHPEALPAAIRELQDKGVPERGLHGVQEERHG